MELHEHRGGFGVSEATGVDPAGSPAQAEPLRAAPCQTIDSGFVMTDEVRAKLGRDNASVQHKAGGSFEVGEPRRFWRYVVAGDRPA